MAHHVLRGRGGAVTGEGWGSYRGGVGQLQGRGGAVTGGGVGQLQGEGWGSYRGGVGQLQGRGGAVTGEGWGSYIPDVSNKTLRRLDRNHEDIQLLSKPKACE